MGVSCAILIRRKTVGSVKIAREDVVTMATCKLIEQLISGGTARPSVVCTPYRGPLLQSISIDMSA